MGTDALYDIDEFDPLLLRRSAPALEPTLVEDADDLFERVFLWLPIPVPSGVWILWLKLTGRRIKTDVMVEFRALERHTKSGQRPPRVRRACPDQDLRFSTWG